MTRRDWSIPLPVLDGPAKGLTFAWPIDYFYWAELPPAELISHDPTPPCRPIELHKYRYDLKPLTDGGWAWCLG
jgi:hypothetical protein